MYVCIQIQGSSELHIAIQNELSFFGPLYQWYQQTEAQTAASTIQNPHVGRFIADFARPQPVAGGVIKNPTTMKPLLRKLVDNEFKICEDDIKQLTLFYPALAQLVPYIQTMSGLRKGIMKVIQHMLDSKVLDVIDNLPEY